MHAGAGRQGSRDRNIFACASGAAQRSPRRQRNPYGQVGIPVAIFAASGMGLRDPTRAAHGRDGIDLPAVDGGGFYPLPTIIALAHNTWCTGSHTASSARDRRRRRPLVIGYRAIATIAMASSTRMMGSGRRSLAAYGPADDD
jgi:hypothetical protein